MIIPYIDILDIYIEHLTFSRLIIYTYKALFIKVILLANVFRAALHNGQNICFGIKEACISCRTLDKVFQNSRSQSALIGEMT